MASEEVSRDRAAVWFAERYDVAGAARPNENLRKLLSAFLEQSHEADATWLRVIGTGAGKRYRVQLDGLAAALEQHTPCETCGRPALRGDGGCGFCGHGRTGRPRERHEAWGSRKCAGCGHEEVAPLYSERQKQWWCEHCNGRGKRWDLVPRAERATILAPQVEALRESWRVAHAQATKPGVIRLDELAKELGVSSSLPYRWRSQGLLPATELMGGRLLMTDKDGRAALIRALARINSPRLLDPARAAAPARIVQRRRRLILPHRAGAPRKDKLHAEWRRLFYELRARLAGWSDFQVCVSVADAHFRAHPEVWARYVPAPDGGIRAEDERKAAQRVWAAIS